jgi:hypothetical protein
LLIRQEHGRTIPLADIWASGLAGNLKELHAKGIDLYLDRQGIDTTTAAGKAMFQWASLPSSSGR